MFAHYQELFLDGNNRAWQIERINGINDINRINNRLIDPCKLGPGLIWINSTLITD